MKNFVLVVGICSVLLAGLACGESGGPGDRVVAAAVKKHLRPFKSEAELEAYLKKFVQRREHRSKSANTASADLAASPAPQAGKALAESESVTNVQHAGVDEGGIVKTYGDYLVVLRRGRLFTVAIGDNTLRPVSSIDAFGPDIEPSGTWYDEMLISGSTIMVIGYSYARGGTEIGLFQIDGSGRLSYRSTYHLRSNDYYSSRNYASRLIGNKLIFYSPLYIWPHGDDVFRSFPAVRRWRKGVGEKDFRRIVPATRVYSGFVEPREGETIALHTVTTCNINSGEMDCEASAVLGPPGNVFYVSSNSVYVWASSWGSENGRSMLYRMPLTGEAPSALQTSGSPVDQFSFLESEDGYLNVLVRSAGRGTWMWNSERSAGDVALMQVRTESFSDGRDAVPASSYRDLPEPEGYTLQNRFVGDYLLYGTGSGWGRPVKNARRQLFAVPRAGGETHQIDLPHGVDRIEALGRNAIVVGTDGTNLHFTSVRLDWNPSVADRYTIKNASQGELRSHGFFYKPETENTGILGLPVRGGGQPGYKHLRDDSAGISFFRNNSLRLTEVGALNSLSAGNVDDGCRASCVDWYGNARPLFLRGRIFALLGYEMVEGRLDDGRIREVRRINYAPQRKLATR